MKTRTIVPLPYAYYVLPVIILALIGLADSIYLSYSHYRVYTDISYKSFCAVSRSINCDTVSQSPYSIFLGLPVPVWGVAGYLFFLLFIPFTGFKKAHPKRLWHILFLIALSFSAYSIILALISTFFIRSYCIMCIVSYLVNLLLLFYCWIIIRRFARDRFLARLKHDIHYLADEKKRFALVFIPYLLCCFTVYAYMPEYWYFTPPTLSETLPTGITETGHPWIGAEHPALVIHEFTDYQCFQCKKMHFFLRRFILENPGRIRLVHKHFPMDSKVNSIIVNEPFHEGSGKLALLAIYATFKGKFWEMNDVLFDMAGASKVIDLRNIAQKTGLDARSLARATHHPKIKQILMHDIREGMKLEITGTPSYVVDGNVYSGIIPASILTKAVNKNM